VEEKRESASTKEGVIYGKKDLKDILSELLIEKYVLLINSK